jgi:hypothetical protein
MNSSSRLRCIIVGLWPVVAAMVALNVILTLAVGFAPPALRRAELLDPDTKLSISERVAAVQQSIRSGGWTERELAVVIGLSTAREGIDPITFERATGGKFRLLNIAGSGGSFRELQFYYQNVFASHLRPRVVILAVHPSWLSGRAVRPQADSLGEVVGNLLGKPTETSWIPLRSWLSGHVWIFGNRVAINTEIRTAMLSLRGLLGELMDLEPGDLVGSDDPWEASIRYGDLHASAEFLSTQLRQWEAFGWFDAHSFDRDTDETAALDDLLRRLKAFAPTTLLVLMPESVEFRSRVPAMAVDRLSRVVLGPYPEMAILDLRASMPDEYFYDHAHLNAAGREAFSNLIGMNVRDLHRRTLSSSTSRGTLGAKKPSDK